MRYWQHDETGRVATSDDDVDLSPRYYEISKEAYEAHEAAQQKYALDAALVAPAEQLPVSVIVPAGEVDPQPRQ